MIQFLAWWPKSNEIPDLPDLNFFRVYSIIGSQYLHSHLPPVRIHRPDGGSSQWSKEAMVFLKIHVENVIWKAIPLELFGEHQGVRLFDSNNQLLASALVQQSLGDAAKSYQEDLLVRESIATQSSFMQPAFVPYPSMK